MDIDYTPSKICKEFMMSNAKMRTLMGPVGSGKSVVNIVHQASFCSCRVTRLDNVVILVSGTSP